MSIKGDAYLRDIKQTGITGTSAQADQALALLTTLPAWNALSYDKFPDAATIQTTFSVVLGFVTKKYPNAANTMNDRLKTTQLDSSEQQHPGMKAQMKTLADAMRNNSKFDPTWKARKASEVAKKVGSVVVGFAGKAVENVTGGAVSATSLQQAYQGAVSGNWGQVAQAGLSAASGLAAQYAPDVAQSPYFNMANQVAMNAAQGQGWNSFAGPAMGLAQQQTQSFMQGQQNPFNSMFQAAKTGLPFEIPQGNVQSMWNPTSMFGQQPFLSGAPLGQQQKAIQSAAQKPVASAMSFFKW